MKRFYINYGRRIMPNYKYNVIIEGEEYSCDSREEAEQLKLDAEEKGHYNVRIKRWWIMDELITEENK